MTSRLEKQLAFVQEIEKLKTISRRNRTLDGRFENSAEHSWHVALLALVFAEYADEHAIDVARVVRMLLIHDLVEIDTGDTWLYDAEEMRGQLERERVCARRLFHLLPGDQAREFLELWEEFATGDTPEARLARAADGLQPLINHLLTGDTAVGDERPSRIQVRTRKRPIADASQQLWELAERLIDESTQRGLYRDE